MTMSWTLSDSAKRDLEKYVSETMRKNGVPGLSLCLIRDGEVVYRRGFGSRSVEPPRPATPDTLYGVGSVSKAFTAMAIMKLWEEGKINLEDPIRKYVKAFEADSQASPVTVHQLLTHTSGFPDLGVAETVISRIFDAPSSWVPLGCLEDLVLRINLAATERVSDKGDRFFYWNEGYALLGAVIEAVSGQGYTDYMVQHVLKPLNMARSSYSASILEKDPDSMTGYISDKDNKKRPMKFPAHPLVDAAGGLISSATELANFVLMCMNNGVFNTTRVIGAEALKKVLTPYVKHSLPPQLAGGDWYGYGFIVNKDFCGHTLIGHGGNIGLSSAYIGFEPVERVGVTMAANTDFDTSQLGLYALAHMLGAQPKEVIPSVAFEEKCELLVGKYETYGGINKMSIIRKGLNLFVEVMGELGGFSFPLVMDGDQVYMVYGAEKVSLETRIHSPEKIDVFIERNVFHKVGKLT
jgi:CubicO group peptidase (beta-lactamase class C family)